MSEHPWWIQNVRTGTCGMPIELGFVGENTARYIRVPCSRDFHHDDNHEVRDLAGQLLAWTGEKPAKRTSSPTYMIQEEP